MHGYQSTVFHVDAKLANELRLTVGSAANAQATGFDGVWLGETRHDPFLPLTLAAEHSSLQLGTSAAMAFARSPMSMAYIAEDLQRFSGGRLTLGLGPQLESHIARRFSMPYSRPVARMREYVAALRAIWSCWRTGDDLDFVGDFYQHTLMLPAFSPGPAEVPPPRVHLAAVGPRMTRLAGEIADGLLVHQFGTPRYLREVTLPALRAGAEAAGRTPADVEVVVPVLIATGRTEESFEAAREAVAQQIAFYGSTPAYVGVWDQHGWGDLGRELQELAMAADPEQLRELIDDEVLDAFAVVGEPDTIARRLRARYGALADRVIVDSGLDAPWAEIVKELKSGTLPADAAKE